MLLGIHVCLDLMVFLESNMGMITDGWVIGVLGLGMLLRVSYIHLITERSRNLNAYLTSLYLNVKKGVSSSKEQNETPKSPPNAAILDNRIYLTHRSNNCIISATLVIFSLSFPISRPLSLSTPSIANQSAHPTTLFPAKIF